MSRLALAFRLFFRTLLGSVPVEQGQAFLEGSSATRRQPDPSGRPEAADAPTRSEAISLLAMLQREARLIDLVQEPLADYSDEQIGAAARGVLSDSAGVLERVFGLQRIVDAQEGSDHETPSEVSVGRYRLTGNVTGNAPFRGRLVHAGWIATRCDLPQWTGEKEDARVIAPVEVEI